MTLDDLARTTKINRHTLQAIETSDVSLLPAAIYTRGFVKAYSREIGLDPDATAQEYMKRIQALTDVAPTAPPGGPAAPPLSMWLASGGDSDPHEHRRRVWIGRTALAVASLGFIVYLTSRGESTRESVLDVIESADVSRAGGPIDVGNAEAPSVAVLDDEPLRLELATQGPCWVSIRAGNETIFAKLLQAGDRERFDVTGEIVVRVGEPGALSYSINGQAGRPLGRPGQPVTIHLSRDNFRELLSS